MTNAEPAGFRLLFRCRLCWRIALMVMLAIVVIETIILIPSYRNYEHDLLTRLEETGKATVIAGLSLYGHFSNRDLLNLGRVLSRNTVLKGGTLYEKDGKILGTFGEAPILTPSQTGKGQMTMVRRDNGNRYEVLWPMGTGALPYILIGRLDSAWIQPELNAFVLRIGGLVLLISVFVTGGTMVVLNRMLLSPLLQLRRRMLATAEDADHPDRYVTLVERDDELGDVIDAFNGLLKRLASNRLRIEKHKLHLLAAKEMAEISNHAKSAFLANMSHELRTPMNAILGYGQFLETNPKDPLTDTQKDHVQQILKGGYHLLELINEILDLARIEAGKINLTIADIAPLEVINECLTLTRPEAERYGITIDNLCAERSLPPVRADQTRFTQVLINLLSNAIKYNRDNGRVILDSQRVSGHKLRITVTDTGHGIPEEKMDELFEPFCRLGAEATDIEGTGVGLTITRQLIDLMHGDMGVDSVVGAGSTFWIDLPLALEGGQTAPITS